MSKIVLGLITVALIFSGCVVKQTENLLAIGKRKITYLRNLRNTTIGVIFVKDVILLILQLKIMDGLMK